MFWWILSARQGTDPGCGQQLVPGKEASILTEVLIRYLSCDTYSPLGELVSRAEVTEAG